MTVCIVLAAGHSQRFGSQKMLHPLANQQPILLATIMLYRQVFDDVSVVVESPIGEVARLATNAGASLVVNPLAAQGMSQSIVAGVTAHSDASRWLIALGDMPYIKKTTVQKMLNNRRTQSRPSIVAPSHLGKMGNPVIFDVSFKAQLLALKGDRGGRSIVDANLSQLDLVTVNDVGVLHDIDKVSDIRMDCVY